MTQTGGGNMDVLIFALMQTPPFNFFTGEITWRLKTKKDVSVFYFIKTFLIQLNISLTKIWENCLEQFMNINEAIIGQMSRTKKLIQLLGLRFIFTKTNSFLMMQNGRKELKPAGTMG